MPVASAQRIVSGSGSLKSGVAAADPKADYRPVAIKKRAFLGARLRYL